MNALEKTMFDEDALTRRCRLLEGSASHVDAALLSLVENKVADAATAAAFAGRQSRLAQDANMTSCTGEVHPGRSQLRDS